MNDNDKKCSNKNININAPIVFVKLKKKKEDGQGGSSPAVVEGLDSLSRTVNEAVRTIAIAIED